MERQEMKAKMDALMQEAKQCVKDIGPLINGLKKAERETDDYQQRVQQADELRVKAMSLMDEYSALSKQLHS